MYVYTYRMNEYTLVLALYVRPTAHPPAPCARANRYSITSKNTIQRDVRVARLIVLLMYTVKGNAHLHAGRRRSIRFDSTMVWPRGARFKAMCKVQSNVQDAKQRAGCKKQGARCKMQTITEG